MVRMEGKAVIGIRFRPDEWEFLAQFKAKTGITLYQLFLRSMEKRLNVITPDQFISTARGNRRNTVIRVKEEEYRIIKERAQQLKVSMDMLTRELILREARELQEGGQDEKQPETGERISQE